jgi:ParB/RepB/Spo0J family partition protein
MSIRWPGIRDIQWDDIVPHPDNPNQLDDIGLKALKEELSKRGFVVPCVVWPHPDEEGKYQLIDGEHRWRVAGEMGLETVPCVVDESADPLEAAVRLLSINQLHGTPVPIRMAHLLADLRERIPETELRERLALGQSELQNYLQLGDFLDEGEGEGGVPHPQAKEPDSRVEIAVVATHKQGERINQLLVALTGDDAEKEPAVLARRAREWVE